MSNPFFTHMANRYRSPRPFNSQSRPYGPRPHLGFQWRPHTHFGPINNSTSDSNDEYWCETCDRGFPTADTLDRHKQQHEKCNIDGCQFVAHPKVITRHIQMQHSSGLYKKICKLDNPEEIQKWKEERKKKYPTRINIEKKAAEYKEKIERGEKMALKQSRNKVDKSTDQPAVRNRTHSFNKKNQNHRTNKPNINQQKNIHSNKDQPPSKKVRKTIPKVPIVVEKNKLKPFTGILSISMDDDDTAEDVCNLINCNNSLIEEDEYNEDLVEQPREKAIQEPVLCGALTSLMCDYRSSDEEGHEQSNNKDTNVAIAKQPPIIDRLHKNVETITKNNTNNQTEIVNYNMKEDLDSVTTKNLANDSDKTIKNEDNRDSDSGPEEVKTVKMNIIETTSLEIPKTKKLAVNAKKSFIPKNDHRHNNRYKHKVPSTLLQKLLYKEIRQERNIVLQCIRYIKKMNNFEKPHE